MQALAVVELFDVFHDCLPGLGLIMELPMPHQFTFRELKKLSTGALSSSANYTN
jgi:hypothetical protein